MNRLAVVPPHFDLPGPPVPRFVYGTAWKEDETERLVRAAIGAGFRGIDTANQRKHYHEAGVGAAIAGAIVDGEVTRDALFVQTKFTSPGGQDHRLPYDAGADAETQVRQSFASSLSHLGVERIDSYVLHGPTVRVGLAPYDLAVWRAMEAIHASGRVRFLGVSNVGIDQLARLCAEARVAPRFVQNRCYASQGWDGEVRAFCDARGIIYQGFSLLTANRVELGQARVRRIAERLGRTPAQVAFRWALQAGMQPLTGTRDPGHMREDLGAFDFALGEEDFDALGRIG